MPWELQRPCQGGIYWFMRRRQRMMRSSNEIKASVMGINCDDDDSPTLGRIMSSSSKYQAHRRAVEARPQKSRSSTAALLYMSMHLLSQMELRSINISIICCHGDEHTSKVWALSSSASTEQHHVGGSWTQSIFHTPLHQARPAGLHVQRHRENDSLVEWGKQQYQNSRADDLHFYSQSL